MSEPTLPGMPESPRNEYEPAVSNTRAARIHTTSLCEQCCRDIHLFGAAGAPYPSVARWRVVEDETALKLCEGHKNERCL